MGGLDAHLSVYNAVQGDVFSCLVHCAQHVHKDQFFSHLTGALLVSKLLLIHETCLFVLSVLSGYMQC